MACTGWSNVRPKAAGSEWDAEPVDRGATRRHSFFFQAEDGIRDYKVTGVQTCALPIYRAREQSRVSDHAVEQQALVRLGRLGQESGDVLEVHRDAADPQAGARHLGAEPQDRKSTRLNSSHLVISYAVFCLKKKKNILDISCYNIFLYCQINFLTFTRLQNSMMIFTFMCLAICMIKYSTF